MLCLPEYRIKDDHEIQFQLTISENVCNKFILQ